MSLVLVVAQSLAWLVTLLAILLDHYWTDGRNRQSRMGRHALLVVVVVAAGVGIIATWWAEERQQRERRETIKRMLSHVEGELGQNFSVLQLKSGQTFTLVTGSTEDNDELWLTLELITSKPFYASVPQIWGDDLNLIALRGHSGSQAFEALTQFYSALEQLQNREAELVRKARDASLERRQQFYIRLLHNEYENFRVLLRTTGESVVPVLKEFGLAEGVNA